MGEPILALRLEGPLQSWGLRSRWDVRDSGDEPTKSGIIGLLACALGWGRGDPRIPRLAAELRMAVRHEHPGNPITDFHTVTGCFMMAEGRVKGEEYTIVSRRTYLQDAGFLVLLAGSLERLEMCRDALAAPCWPLYLGRRSCPPARPVLIGITTEYADLADALSRYPWEWGGRGGLDDKTAAPVLICSIEDKQGGVQRPDIPLAMPSRMYGPRRIRRFRVAMPCQSGKEETT